MPICLPINTKEDVEELASVVRECAELYRARGKRDRINGDFPEAEEQEQRAEQLAGLALRLEEAIR